MKTYVLILSQVFPADHPRAGEPTNFEEKVLCGLGKSSGFEPKIHTMRSNYQYWRDRFVLINKGDACLSIRKWSGLSSFNSFSYAWIFLMLAIIVLTFSVLSSFAPAVYEAFVPQGYGVHIILMVLLYGLHNFNMNVLLGKERVGAQNVLFIREIHEILVEPHSPVA